MKPTRVLLVDDHALIRAGIRALLERIEGVEIVAEAGDGLQALQLIAEHHPDVVLLDLTMPKLGGLEVLRRAERDYPSPRFIVLSVHEQDEYAIQALRYGAAGFIPKSAASSELENALDTVGRGENYLSPRISQQSILRYLKQTHLSGPPNALTPRQREILEMIALGHSTKQIAQLLDITVKTVESHRAQIMARLDIHDVAGLVRYAIRTGMVPVDD
jgi:DNA-binding NarL/FixJ family response regulator